MHIILRPNLPPFCPLSIGASLDLQMGKGEGECWAGGGLGEREYVKKYVLQIYECCTLSDIDLIFSTGER